jgi:hypothetical protein
MDNARRPARTFLQLLEDKIASSDIEVHHRDVLMWLQAIIPEDLITDSRASLRQTVSSRLASVSATLPTADGFLRQVPAAEAKKAQLALRRSLPPLQGWGAERERRMTSRGYPLEDPSATRAH